MKTRKQKGGAIFGLLAGLIASVLAATAYQSGEEYTKEKRGKRDLVT
jgi:hypothetical protein